MLEVDMEGLVLLFAALVELVVVLVPLAIEALLLAVAMLVELTIFLFSSFARRSQFAVSRRRSASAANLGVVRQLTTVI
jgi:hypothetical protein